MIDFIIRFSALLFYFQIIISGVLFAETKKTDEVEKFWRILFKEYHFGYTLFGDKPISFDRYYLYQSDTSSFFKHRNHLLDNLWPLWEEQHSKFNSHNYVIKRVQFKDLNTELEEFYLINKSKSLFIIKKHWKKFKRYFNQFDKPKQLLEAICENGPHIIKNHRLLGLLLGYGEHDTKLFQKQHILFERLASLIYLQEKETLLSIPPKELISLICARKQCIILPCVSWKLLWKEYENTNAQLSSSLNTLIPYRQLLAIPLVSYRLDPNHPENKKILEKNLKTQKILKTIYYDPRFLEIILRKLEK